jgi:putative DNA primase/helicase
MRPPPTFGEIAPRLEEAGYEPIPITLPRPDDPQAGKRPAVADWTKGGAVAQWLPRYRHYGVGILTRRTPAVDIDVRHLDAAEAVEALAYRVLGQAPVRIGLAPKRLLVYRAAAPFPKLKSGLFIMPGDVPDEPGYKPHAVEILGDGEQFVAFGTHPGTGRPYHWLDDSLLDLMVEDLTEVTEERARGFLAEAEGIFLRHGGHPFGQSRARRNEAPRTERRTSPKGLRAELARIRSALAAISNPDLHHDDWLEIGIAIKGAVGEEGGELFHEFSERSLKYDPATTDAKWNSIREVREKGAGSIFHLARMQGWSDPDPSPEHTSLLPYYKGPTLPRQEALQR